MLQKLFPSLIALGFSSLVMLNLAGCGGNSKKAELSASTPEEFSQSVVSTLIENDADGFIKFVFPTKEELLAFVRAHAPESQKERTLEQIDKEYAERRARILDSFGKVRKAVETEGGDWQSVTKNSTNYDLKKKDGITGTSIYVEISVNNQTLGVQLAGCLLINDHWYTMNEITLRGEYVHPVTGKLLHDGKPLANARIRLQAATPGASRVYACDSKADGTFSIEAAYSTGIKQGAPAGTYNILVGKFNLDTTLEIPESKNEINEKFNNPSTTPLNVEVIPGKNNITIDLKSDGTGTVK